MLGDLDCWLSELIMISLATLDMFLHYVGYNFQVQKILSNVSFQQLFYGLLVRKNVVLILKTCQYPRQQRADTAAKSALDLPITKFELSLCVHDVPCFEAWQAIWNNCGNALHNCTFCCFWVSGKIFFCFSFERLIWMCWLTGCQFWAFYSQLGSSMGQTDRQTDRWYAVHTVASTGIC